MSQHKIGCVLAVVCALSGCSDSATVSKAVPDPNLGVLFAPAERYLASLAGNGPAQGGVTSADLDSDGDADIIASDSIGNAIAVLLNNGDGSLTPFARYQAGLQPVALTSGDWNADGVPDIAVTHARSDDIQVFFGNGDGSLVLAASHRTGLGPTDIAATDLDRDGDLDLLVYWGNVTVLLNDGAGVFTAGPELVTGESLGAIAIAMEVADFNQDGWPDVAITDWPTGPIASRTEVFHGTGTGGFVAGSGPFSSSGANEAMRSADINCDGRPDLVVPVAGGSLLIFEGQADGHLGEPVEFETDSGSNAVEFADFNQDGRLDMALSFFNGSVGIALDVCTDLALDQTHGTVETSEALISPDLNGDGRPDLVVGTWYQPQLAVLLSAINGH